MGTGSGFVYIQVGDLKVQRLGQCFQLFNRGLEGQILQLPDHGTVVAGYLGKRNLGQALGLAAPLYSVSQTFKRQSLHVSILSKMI